MPSSQPVRSRLGALAALAVAPALAALTPAPSTTWAALTAPAADPTAPLVALVGLAAWACSGWLLLVVAATSGGRLPGLTGRVARRVAGRLAPASVRGLVRVALGTTVALSALGGSANAWADDRPAVTSSYDWPGVAMATAPTTAPTTAPRTGPTTTPSRVHRDPLPATPAATRPAAPTRRHTRGPVVVRTGDSLWSIAAAELGPRTSPAQIAHAWPQWWHANRALLGDHPELIRPGDRLVPPATRPAH